MCLTCHKECCFSLHTATHNHAWLFWVSSLFGTERDKQLLGRKFVLQCISAMLSPPSTARCLVSYLYNNYIIIYSSAQFGSYLYTMEYFNFSWQELSAQRHHYCRAFCYLDMMGHFLMILLRPRWPYSLLVVSAWEATGWVVQMVHVNCSSRPQCFIILIRTLLITG